MLMMPEKFDWAKGILHSNIWDIITDDNMKEQSISFNIPDKCISCFAPTCQLTEIINDKMTEAKLMEGTSRLPQVLKGRGEVTNLLLKVR